MNIQQKSQGWLNPGVQMWTTTGISAITAYFSFRSTELDRETLVTFFAYYLILIAMTIMFGNRSKLINPKTRQLLQFSFFLLGFVLMLTGVLGTLNGNLNLASVFMLIIFLPGLTTLRAGLHFNKSGA